MCRNIVPLFNFEPPATEEEIHDAALQFVRKVSGFRKPSQANQAAFDRSVEEIAGVVLTLLEELVTTQPPHTREERVARQQAKNARRFGSAGGA